MKQSAKPPFAGAAQKSILDGVERAQPAVSRTLALLDRTTAANWVWPTEADQRKSIARELAELNAECDAPAPDRQQIESEAADLLFTVIDFMHYNGIDPERALHAMIDERWEPRVRYMESALSAQGRDFRTSTFKEQLALWKEAKEHERARNDDNAAKTNRPPAGNAEIPARKP